MFIVKFSDNIEFKFTERQIKLIPYFRTLVESNFKTELEINHSSLGFEFIYNYATLDEIDIIDPQDRYLFVLKQCDFFCYDKLKELIEKKYGFRTNITEIKDKINQSRHCQLTYLGSIKLSLVNLAIDKKYCIIDAVNIEVIYEPPIFSDDIDINNIFVERYKQSIKLYYDKLLNDLFSIGEIIYEKIHKYNEVKEYILLLMPSSLNSYIFDKPNFNKSISNIILLIKRKYMIRIVDNIIQIYTTNLFDT